MSKEKKPLDTCECCSQPKLGTCQGCFRRFHMRDGKILPHDSSVCVGSHMEYNQCPGGTKAPFKHA